MPSGGSVSTPSFSSSHTFCPVDGTSITRVVFVIARGRDTEGRDTERRAGNGSPGACERREGNFEGERPRPPRADSRAKRLEYPPRDFALTLARDCVSLTPHRAFRIPINSRRRRHR